MIGSLWLSACRHTCLNKYIDSSILDQYGFSCPDISKDAENP